VYARDGACTGGGNSRGILWRSRHRDDTPRLGRSGDIVKDHGLAGARAPVEARTHSHAFFGESGENWHFQRAACCSMTHQTRTPDTVMDQHGVVAGPVRLDTARPLHSCGLWPSRTTHSRPGQAGWPLIEHILSHTVCIRMLFNVIERTTRGTSRVPDPGGTVRVLYIRSHPSPRSAPSCRPNCACPVSCAGNRTRFDPL
jgi:hypothetical protein